VSADSPRPAPWLTATEALAEFGARPSHLEKWRRSCLVLGRPIRTKPSPRGFLYWRHDLAQVREARDNPPSPRYTDQAGQVWVSRQIATSPPYAFSFQRLTRWHLDKRGCPFLDVDRVRHLQAQRLPVYKPRGFQLQWYFLEAELQEIRNNLRAGTVVSKVHGPGLTGAEAEQHFGFGRALLDAWSDRQGAGVRELGGRRLQSWHEARLSPHGHITRYRVYDLAQLREIDATHRPPASKGNVAARHDAAEEFLREQLAGGPAPAKEVARQARARGISGERLKAARRALGVARSFQGRAWRWSLPGDQDGRRGQAVRVLRKILADGPKVAGEVRRVAAAVGVSEAFLRQAKHELGVTSRRRRLRDPWSWCLPGQEPAEAADRDNRRHPGAGADDATGPSPAGPGELADGHRAGGPNGDREESPGATGRRPGRKPGWRDWRAEDRNRTMVEAWQAGRYLTITALARAFHVSRGRASQILKQAGASILSPAGALT
jgi:hypothetical protein